MHMQKVSSREKKPSHKLNVIHMHANVHELLTFNHLSSMLHLHFCNLPPTFACTQLRQKQIEGTHDQLSKSKNTVAVVRQRSWADWLHPVYFTDLIMMRIISSRGSLQTATLSYVQCLKQFTHARLLSSHARGRCHANMHACTEHR